MSPSSGDRSPAAAGFDSGSTDRLVGEMRTPRAAAIAGILFAVILTGVAVLLHLAVPGNSDKSQWITDAARRQDVSRALELVPFAGIAFLWFIGVIRSRLGAREDKFFATAFLGSGLLFVAMLFAAAASIGALLIVYTGPGSVPANEVLLVSETSSVLLSTFGVRMAAVFTLVVTNLGRRTAIVPGWLQVVGYVVAVVLLLAPPRTFWAVLLFPVWVFLLSVHILIASARTGSVTAGVVEPAGGA
jgi:hypothetical protein